MDSGGLASIWHVRCFLNLDSRKNAERRIASVFRKSVLEDSVEMNEMYHFLNQ